MIRLTYLLFASVIGSLLVAPARADKKDHHKKEWKEWKKAEERSREFHKKQAERAREADKKYDEWLREGWKRQREYDKEQQKRYAEWERETYRYRGDPASDPQYFQGSPYRDWYGQPYDPGVIGRGQPDRPALPHGLPPGYISPATPYGTGADVYGQVYGWLRLRPAAPYPSHGPTPGHVPGVP